MAEWDTNDPITPKEWVKAMFDLFLGRTKDMLFDTAEMADDIVVQREGVGRYREWQHGPLPKDRACDKVTKPIYVPIDPRGIEKMPDPCRECGNDEWYSGGIVLRGKDTKNVVHREKSTAPPKFTGTVAFTGATEATMAWPPWSNAPREEIKWFDELKEFVDKKAVKK